MINKSVSNKYKNEGFGMQKSKDDLLGVSNELVEIFAKSLGIFSQSIEKSI
jgi:hypothetical protein